MSEQPVFLYVAAYDDEADARADYDILLDLHTAGVVGTYDAAVITKSDDGKVHVHKHEKPTQHGAWTGVGVGAVLGILFPPSILASAVVGGVSELGETLDAGQAGLVVVGRSKLDEVLDRELKRASKRLEKQIRADADALDAAAASSG